jgi:hypothetical protein
LIEGIIEQDEESGVVLGKIEQRKKFLPQKEQEAIPHVKNQAQLRNTVENPRKSKASPKKQESGGCLPC